MTAMRRKAERLDLCPSGCRVSREAGTMLAVGSRPLFMQFRVCCTLPEVAIQTLVRMSFSLPCSRDQALTRY